MKRSIALVIIFIGTFCLCFSGIALGETSFYISELNMRIKMPDDLIVFPRDIESNDENLSLFVLDEKDLEEYFKENNIYLNSIEPEREYEIVITMVENAGTHFLYDYNAYTDRELQEFSQQLINELNNNQYGAKYTDSFVWGNHSQAKFFKIYFERPNNDDKAYCVQYYTIINGQEINITLHSFNGTISIENEKLMTEIISSISFTHVFKKPLTKINAIDDNANLPINEVTEDDGSKFNGLYAIQSAIGIPEGTSGTLTTFYLILSLILTVAIYTIPIIIFRYLIVKHPVKKMKAILVTVVGFFISFTILYFIVDDGSKPGRAAGLWTFVNYVILTRGYNMKKNDKNLINENKIDTENSYEENKESSFYNEKNEIKPLNATTLGTANDTENKGKTEIIDEEQVLKVTQNSMTDVFSENNIESDIENKIETNENITTIEDIAEDDINFCRKCGSKITNDSVFCYKCGNKVR